MKISAGILCPIPAISSAQIPESISPAPIQGLLPLLLIWLLCWRRLERTDRAPFIGEQLVKVGYPAEDGSKLGKRLRRGKRRTYKFAWADRGSY